MKNVNSFKRIRKLSVSNIEKISLNMLRITLSSNELSDFPKNHKGGYVKLLFKDKKTNNDLVRPYTIRDFRKNTLELDIDFALHGCQDLGYASSWASKAKIGDEILVSGPSSKKIVKLDCNWFFFIGDMSALPAISVNMEELPEESKGYAIIEILSEKDKQKILKPKNIKIHWIINSTPKNNPRKLLEEVRKIDWFDTNPFIWVACEFNAMKNLRSFFYKEKKISKENIYISSYWKSGLNQEGHKKLKKEDLINWDQ